MHTMRATVSVDSVAEGGKERAPEEHQKAQCTGREQTACASAAHSHTTCERFQDRRTGTGRHGSPEPALLCYDL